mmetsp:Transcript_25426/g.42286  ORF Transcript_25426/g.42286 Transcript_25426/m.42286 type:complete len:219 (+) Transcript_25426:1041-1697(+)
MFYVLGVSLLLKFSFCNSVLFEKLPSRPICVISNSTNHVLQLSTFSIHNINNFISFSLDRPHDGISLLFAVFFAHFIDVHIVFISCIIGIQILISYLTSCLEFFNIAKYFRGHNTLQHHAFRVVKKLMNSKGWNKGGSTSDAFILVTLGDNAFDNATYSTIRVNRRTAAHTLWQGDFGLGQQAFCRGDNESSCFCVGHKDTVVVLAFLRSVRFFQVVK